MTAVVQRIVVSYTRSGHAWWHNRLLGGFLEGVHVFAVKAGLELVIHQLPSRYNALDAEVKLRPCTLHCLHVVKAVVRDDVMIDTLVFDI